MKTNNNIVIKYDGKPAFRKKCRRIKGQYYEKNKDCFLVDGRWNRINNGLIYYDYAENQYLKKSNAELRLGYVNETLDKKYINIQNSYIFVDGNFYLNEEVLLSHGYKESINSEKYIKSDVQEKKKISADYGSLKYNLKDIYTNFDGKDNYSNIKEYGFDPVFKMLLEDFKFGFEFETINGYVRKRKLIDHNVTPLKDGSLRWSNGLEPYEFVTLPLEVRNKGLDVITSFCEVLDTHCEVNTKCSLHLHLSKPSLIQKILENFSNFGLLYKYFTLIQNQMINAFPKYIQHPEIVGKSKKYAGPLEAFPISVRNDISRNLQYILNSLFQDFTMSTPNGEVDIERSIEVARTKDKWKLNGRYKWVNFLPLLLNGWDNKTIEFRIHEGTFNKIEILNWLLICVTLLDYFEKVILVNPEKVNTFTFSNIFESRYFGNQMLEYLKDRSNFHESVPIKVYKAHQYPKYVPNGKHNIFNV